MKNLKYLSCRSYKKFQNIFVFISINQADEHNFNKTGYEILGMTKLFKPTKDKYGLQ